MGIETLLLGGLALAGGAAGAAASGAFSSKPAAAMPRATPAAPRIGDGEAASLQRAEGSRQRRKKGADDTILTAGGLGDVGGSIAPAASVQRTSLLGGG